MVVHRLVKPVVMVLFMLCSAVLIEWLLLKPCCVDMWDVVWDVWGDI